MRARLRISMALALLGGVASAATLDPAAPPRQIASALASIREAGPDAGAAAAVSGMLHEESPLFRGRTPSEVARLRAQLFLTLASTGVPRDALPLIVAELGQGHKPLTLAAAARAAAAAGPDASAAAPHLTRLLGADFHDEQVSLDDFEPAWPLRSPTTARIEAVRALASFGELSRDALPALRALAGDDAIVANQLGPLLLDEIRAAIVRIEPPAAAAHAHCLPEPELLSFSSGWREPAQRKADSVFDVLTARELHDKPVALTFFYTRCDNERKCSTTMSRFAQLQAAAAAARLSGNVRLLAITYDPEYDTPFHLARFAAARGLRLDDDVRLLRTTPAQLAELVRTVGLAVNFADGRPNIHGVELFVLDRKGRVAREYRNGGWDVPEVVDDLRRLVRE